MLVLEAEIEVLTDTEEEEEVVVEDEEELEDIVLSSWLSGVEAGEDDDT